MVPVGVHQLEGPQDKLPAGMLSLWARVQELGKYDLHIMSCEKWKE